MSHEPPWDPDKTPVRTPSGTLRVGLAPCPKCRRDERVDCDLCLDDEGRPARYVPVDQAIQWTLAHAEEIEDTEVVELDDPMVGIRPPK